MKTRIEKMQEMFNKDLEETKKSQSVMNNGISEIKSTLERRIGKMQEILNEDLEEIKKSQ